MALNDLATESSTFFASYPASSSIILAIKPRYAEAILNGEKLFEFRKKVFARSGVKRVYIYASSPICAVIGEFEIEEILTSSPSNVWSKTKHAGGISRQTFYSYFENAPIAHALKISRARRYAKPKDLGHHFGVPRPPQSFCYVAR